MNKRSNTGFIQANGTTSRADMIVGTVWALACIGLTLLSVFVAWLPAILGASDDTTRNIVNVAIAAVFTYGTASAFWVWYCNREHKDQIGQGRRVVFQVLLPFIAAMVALANEYWLGPKQAAPPSAQRKVIIFIDVSAAVCFANEQGRHFGPGVFEHNGLLCMSRELVRLLSLHIEGFSRTSRPAFGELCKWFVNWELAPSPAHDQTQFSDPQLYLAAGDWVKCVNHELAADVATLQADKSMTRLERAMVQAIEAEQAWPPRALGLSGIAQWIQTETRENRLSKDDVVVLISTGDIDSADEKAAWHASLGKTSARVVSLQLPSIPRSGRRGSASKALVLKSPHSTFVWLEDRLPAGVSPDLQLALYASPAGKQTLDAQDADYWDGPETLDLDVLRRDYFGRSNLIEPKSPHLQAAWEQLVAIIFARHSKDEEPETSHDDGKTRWVALALGVPLLLLCLPTMLAGCSFEEVDDEDKVLPQDRRIGWKAFIYCLIWAFVSIVLIAVMTVCCWPGADWIQTGRPTLAIWAFSAMWAMLFLYPLGIHHKKALWWWSPLAVLSVVLAPIVGLGFACRDVRLNGVAVFGPLLLMIYACWKTEFSRQSTKKPSKANLWARPVRWGALASAIAFWVALLFVGIVPASAANAQHSNMVVVSLIVIVMWGWLATRR